MQLKQVLSAVTHICASADHSARMIEVIPLYALFSLLDEQKESGRQTVEQGAFEKFGNAIFKSGQLFKPDTVY